MGESADSDALNFEVGEAVCLKDSVIRGKKYKPQDLSPKLLILRVGWPNVFYVERTAEGEDGPAISLSACCCNLMHRDRYRCRYHPAHLFERVDFEKIRPEVPGEGPRSRKADRAGSASVPFIGKVASYQYFEDEKDPGLVLNIAGKVVELHGAFAKHLYKLAQDKGVL